MGICCIWHWNDIQWTISITSNDVLAKTNSHDLWEYCHWTGMYAIWLIRLVWNGANCVSDIYRFILGWNGVRYNVNAIIPRSVG